jgi:hypothetical protein
MAPFRSEREGCRSPRGFSAEIARHIPPAWCALARRSLSWALVALAVAHSAGPAMFPTL